MELIISKRFENSDIYNQIDSEKIIKDHFQKNLIATNDDQYIIRFKKKREVLQKWVGFEYNSIFMACLKSKNKEIFQLLKSKYRSNHSEEWKEIRRIEISVILH